MLKFIKKMISVMLVCISVTALATGCKKNTDGDIPQTQYVASTWSEMPKNTNANLKYFGYFHSDGFNGGEEYFSDIASLNNANVMMINSGFDVAVALERLEQTREYGMQAIVTLHGLFSNQQVGQIGAAVLNAKWLSIWRNMLGLYEEFIEDETILAFYFDEPYWNGIKEDDFLLVTNTIRKECPSVKLMACLTAVEIGARAGKIDEVSENYYRYCTDLMYDSYIDWNDEQRREFSEKLAKKAKNNQYFWGCPKGYVDSYEEEGNEEMLNHLKGFYTEAIQNERFAGIISFSYAGGLDGGDWGYGLNTFFDVDTDNAYYDEALRDLYLQIGREITGRTESAKSAPTVMVETETQVRAIGDIEIPQAVVSDGGETVSLTPKITVYAPDGKIIETSDGYFTATQGGRYIVAYTVIDSDYNATKIKHAVWVRGEGELSAFESELYLSDITLGAGWNITFERSRTYAGSRGGVKVEAIGETNRELLFNVDADLSGLFTDICVVIYNPTVTAFENLAIFVTDGEHIVQAVSSLNPKKYTQLTITREYILTNCPEFNFTNAQVGIKQVGETSIATFYLDDAKIR